MYIYNKAYYIYIYIILSIYYQNPESIRIVLRMFTKKISIAWIFNQVRYLQST